MELLDKPDFLAFIFLYAASADLKLTQAEIDIITEKSGPEHVKKAKKIYDSYSDYERIEFILAHRDKLFPTEAEKDAILQEMKQIFLADNIFSIEEQNLYRALNRLM